MKSIQRILLTLFSVLAPWIMGAATVQAALLNDIRVGDYDTHTRIVFELSEATVFERIISRKPGQLTIIFPNAKPQLIRKIPTERSARVQEITLFRRQDSLSVVLAFSFEHFRYELKEYQAPFRLVIDVYHLGLNPASQPRPDKASEIIETRDDRWHQEQPPASLEQDPSKTPTPSNEAENPLTQPGTTGPPAADQPQSDMPPLPRLAQSEKHQAVPGQTTPQPESDNGLQATDNTIPDAKGLQYYLVIGMVIMTIVILLLLLLMLIFKQPKSEGQSLSAAGKDLRQQDKHIATLNAKIHEQLKRYDEA